MTAAKDFTESAPVTVYLIHYERAVGGTHPKGKMQHYLGSTNNLKRRLIQHRDGKSGAGVVREFYRLGIPFELARVWENVSREDEYKIKRRHNAPKLCPICQKAKGK